jgi:Skp family chaperone for outer membrane proteins
LLRPEWNVINFDSKGVLTVARFESLRFLFLTLTLAVLAPSVCFGQSVAIIDVAAVFKAHQTFTQQLDAIRNQAEALRTNSMQVQQEFARKAEVLKQYDPASQQFRDTEAALAKEAALLDMNQKDQIRQLMQAEAKLHYDTYQQVNQLIASFCDNQGITLVLRYANDSLDEANPESIMLKVNSSIIYHQPGRDITSQIIAMLPNAEHRSSR